jgi:hypothetical protein
MKLPGNLPVKTRIPGMAWVLAGLITLFSLMQSNVATKPAFESQLASATVLMGSQR